MPAPTYPLKFESAPMAPPKSWWIRKDREKVTRPRATWITRWVPDDRNHGSNQRQPPTSELGRRDVDFPREPQNHHDLGMPDAPTLQGLHSGVCG